MSAQKLRNVVIYFPVSPFGPVNESQPVCVLVHQKPNETGMASYVFRIIVLGFFPGYLMKTSTMSLIVTFKLSNGHLDPVVKKDLQGNFKFSKILKILDVVK
ncbi:hypothetical protein TSAR_007451 [Trichomalopsis sarcophagae]|uniref:Uncharacterized protein n=1 Tax=Trichomalopsis sarcophagae TaxID=543379 RepID=A0A232EJ92_9HYME|nr:hypothetical protein TSAR_007451 [Trichomalopsis sarcophagae]